MRYLADASTFGIEISYEITRAVVTKNTLYQGVAKMETESIKSI